MARTHNEEHQPRILIVRLTAIGDCIHGMPLLCALREKFPRAFLAWVVEGHAGDLLEGHDALDELIRVPRRWLKSPRAVWTLRRRLKQLRFDISIDAQGLTKSAVAAWLSGARRRIGFAGADGRELSCLLNNERIEPTATHVIDRNLELLRPLGIDRPAVSFRVPTRAADAQCMKHYVQVEGLAGGFALINPGAGWPSKLWPTDRFGSVAQHLGTVHRFPVVVVWAGESEYGLAREVVSASAGQARLAPATSLTELAALVRCARLFVASDTGPLHLAVAVGTPSIGLFGPMPHERNGPYGQAHIAIQEAVLEGSSRMRRSATNATMLAISVERVRVACDEMLSRDAPEKLAIAG